MSNHFHILATSLEKETRSASKEELSRRYRLIYGQDADPLAGSYDTSGQLIPDADEGVERLRRRLKRFSIVKRLTEIIKSYRNFHFFYAGLNR